jgi:regulatory protein
MRSKKPITREEALLKMADLCSRSEQCRSEIARKLQTKGLYVADIESVVKELIDRGFINEERYARSFANDKVRFSAWGRLKIRAALAVKRIPSSAVAAALEQIDEEEYADAAFRAARAKASYLDLSEYDDRQKLYRHLLSRGFESKIAAEAMKKLKIEN